MNQGYETIPASAATDPSQKADIRLRGGLLTLTRVTWIVLVLLALTLFAGSVPFYFGQLNSICTTPHCGQGPLTEHDVQVLQSLGLSLNSYAASLVAIKTMSALVWFATGIVIFLRKPGDWIAMFVSFFLVTFAITFNGDMMMALPSAYWLPGQIVRFLGSVCFGLFFNLFPDGRFMPRWMLWFALPSILWQAGRTFFSGTPYDSDTWPILLGLTTWVGFGGLLIYAQIYRYRRVSNAVHRQQTKWVVFGLSTALLGFLAFLPIFAALKAPGPLINIIGNTTIYLCMLLIPLSISVAILRYRLWDIDILINRTLVYGILTACVISIYVLVVGYLGALFHTQGNLVISLLVTGVVAVLFQPLKERLQRGVNRLLYGQRDEPYQVFSRLGQRLEATLAPDAVLTVIVETVAQALRLPYAAIVLKQEQNSSIATSHGTLVEPVFHLPLLYQSEQVGELLLAPRGRGESFSPADRRLLEDLARQVGIAAHAVRLTADLQQSRERLVTAREEERRRLRRDLHDGLGPQLSSQTLLLTSVQMLLRQDPDEAEAILASAIAQSQQAIGDIRRLVYALRPPALDDLGLVAAIQEQLTQNRASGIDFSFDTPELFPPLPAAVEVACYRIVQEAITNVVRHAYARHCTVRLTCKEQLTIRVIDDGQGLPPGYRCGVGLNSMRERAEELGGNWHIEPGPNGGTCVHAELPYR